MIKIDEHTYFDDTMDATVTYDDRGNQTSYFYAPRIPAQFLTDEAKAKAIPLEDLTDIRRFVDRHVKGPWTERTEPIYLYHNEQSRLKITVERAPSFDGLWRHEALASMAIDSNHLDGQILGQTFVNEVCDELSINDMRYIRDALAKAIDAWEEVHEPSPR